MSSDEPQTVTLGKNWKLLGLAAALVVTVVVFPFLIVGSSKPPTTTRGAGSKRDEDNALEAARAALQRRTDLSACRSAVQQVNAYLGANPNVPRAALPADRAERLRTQFGLDSGELAEVQRGDYTPLDGHHLDACFLLRDAARSLEVKGLPNGPDGKPLRPTPLDRASAAFAWVMRQVRLGPADEPAPPAFALRRGWGTAAERSMIFLDLLEQLRRPDGDGGAADLVGCLVMCPGKDGKQRLWACGVVAGEGPDVYLFDPRLGLPLPGPKGEGVATLAAVAKGPALLAQLTVDDKHPYDVTAEQARAAVLRLYRPLSALAPRMKDLQEKWLGPALQVRLADDAEKDLARLQAAARGQGLKESAVEVWQDGTKLLRHFLPPDEGGADQPRRVPLRELAGFTTPDDPSIVRMGRRQLFTLRLAPWTSFPVQFRNPGQFRFDVGLGERLHTRFAEPFLAAALGPDQPRDLLLRGRYTEAARKLVEEQDEVWPQVRRRRANAPELDRRVHEWVQKALGAYAAQLRAGNNPDALAAANQQVAEVWKEGEPVATLLQGAMAGPRSAEVVYQLGLCKQEQAERLQARLDLLAQAPDAAAGKSEAARAQGAWRDALRWWNVYAEEHARGPAAAAARRQRGRAQQMLGDGAAAVAAWSALSDDMAGLEKVACLYLAKQARQK